MEKSHFYENFPGAAMAFSLNYARDLQALFRGLLNIPRGFIEQVNHGKNLIAFTIFVMTDFSGRFQVLMKGFWCCQVRVFRLFV